MAGLVFEKHHPHGAGGWSSAEGGALVGKIQLGWLLKRCLGAAGQLPGGVRGSARPACAGHQGGTSLAWFPKPRHSQGQHAVTSWDLGFVVLGPQRGCRPFPQPPFLPGRSLVCSDCSIPPRDRHGAPPWSPERTAVSWEQSFRIESK